ncbi:hypothetical protein SNOG_07365 [Parastagonospora nodorum SN15]|uniref:Uncharacterized protein n=1 Tax=Phaeosphaeria nodorum (strain SN15 / ATCC MYA-4574 / FGSC 10173) TaxID=321614 RepID=Q0ULJ9_PHANO|nr:hypothetical protein SNOG_07365 [Parastagonospora nodorum SN15]EAT84831.1 hypothetical protein SNOG_07365 [Parastagonospora nodorum SN15]
MANKTFAGAMQGPSGGETDTQAWCSRASHMFTCQRVDELCNQPTRAERAPAAPSLPQLLRQASP